MPPASNSQTNNPPSPNSPSNGNQGNQNNGTNTEKFQSFRNQSKELITQTEKIIANYTKRISEFKTANEKAKKEAQEIGQEFDMEQGEIGKVMKDLEHHLEIAKRNKTTLTDYTSEKDYQTFLSASSETQQSNLDLIQDAIKHTIKSTQENLSDCLNCTQKVIKVTEEMFQELKESGLDNEELAKQEKELEENKTTITNLQTKLGELEKQSINEQIKTLSEVWTTFEKMEAQSEKD